MKSTMTLLWVAACLMIAMLIALFENLNHSFSGKSVEGMVTQGDVVSVNCIESVGVEAFSWGQFLLVNGQEYMESRLVVLPLGEQVNYPFSIEQKKMTCGSWVVALGAKEVKLRLTSESSLTGTVFRTESKNSNNFLSKMVIGVVICVGGILGYLVIYLMYFWFMNRPRRSSSPG